MIDYFALSAAGFVAWIVSTIAGGGGAMLLVPLVGFIAGAHAVAPVTAIATLIAGSGRAITFRKDVDWRVVVWALPGAVTGALLGSLLFVSLATEWLQAIVGIFLISTILQYRIGANRSRFHAPRWWFFPAEMLVGFLSALVGAMGPIMNALYLNAGITKSRMVGTKTAISLPMHFTKLFTYGAFGALSGELLLFGIAAGVGALASNRLAKRLLDRMSDVNFRGLVIGFMVLSGVQLLWTQRDLLIP